MTENDILVPIWSDAVEESRTETLSPLAQVLDTLLDCPTVCLISHLGLSQPCALLESDEVLPGTPLGDILEEELNINIPVGAVVLFEPAEFAQKGEYSGAELGRVLGTILIELVSKGQQTKLGLLKSSQDVDSMDEFALIKPRILYF